MPFLEIKTNVKLENPKEFVAEFSQFSATLLNKPQKYICVSYVYNEFLAWEGTFEPAFVLSIVSLNNFDAPGATDELSKTLFTYMEEKLSVPDHRGFVLFNDPGPANIGHRSTSVSTLAKDSQIS